MNARAAIAELLAARAPGGTICPSEAARLLAGPHGDWRARMHEVHEAAAAMAVEAGIVLSWKGARKFAPDGPYRIGRGA